MCVTSIICAAASPFNVFRCHCFRGSALHAPILDPIYHFSKRDSSWYACWHHRFYRTLSERRFVPFASLTREIDCPHNKCSGESRPCAASHLFILLRGYEAENTGTKYEHDKRQKENVSYNVFTAHRLVDTPNEPTFELMGAATVSPLPASGGPVEEPEHWSATAPLMAAAAGDDVDKPFLSMSGACGGPCHALAGKRGDGSTPFEGALWGRQICHPLRPVREAADRLRPGHPKRRLVRAAIDLTLPAEDIHEALQLMFRAGLRNTRALHAEKRPQFAFFHAARSSRWP